MKALRSLALLLVISLSPLVSRALDPNLTLFQYDHTTFGEQAGVPPDVFAPAQSADGYLWFATSDGLYRFDGTAFEAVRSLDGVDLPSMVISALVPSGDGFWVSAGKTTYRHQGGHLVRWGEEHGFPSIIQGAAADDAGVVWIATSTRELWRVEGGHRAQVGADWGLSFRTVGAVEFSRDGTLWVSNTDRGGGLAWLPKGARRFRYIDTPGEINLSTAPDNSVWISGLTGYGKISVDVHGDGKLRWTHIENFHGGAMVVDHEGGLWLAGLGGIAHAGHPDALLASDGEARFRAEWMPLEALGAGFIWTVWEAPDGTVWLSTASGVVRFRQTRLTPIVLPGEQKPTALASADGGGVWALRYASGLLHVSGSSVTESTGLGQMPGASTIYRSPDGALWAAGDGGVWHDADGHGFEQLPLPKTISTASAVGMTQDGQGRLWVAFMGGLACLEDGQWRTLTAADGFPAHWVGIGVATDAGGHVWFGGRNNELMEIDNARATMHAREATGLNVGSVRVLYVKAGHLWIGGSEGAGLMADGRFRPLLDDTGAPFKGITGIVETDGGDLWLHGGGNAWRIPASGLRSASPQLGRVHAERLGASDGLRGKSSAVLPPPSLIQASDGKLWFSTNAGLVTTNPEPLPVSRTLVPLRLRTIVADNVALAPSDQLTLPVGVQRLQIGYTLPLVGGIEHLRYRYRLDGLDDDWNDAGDHREATYTNLGPGTYRFRVMARDGEGDWQGDATLATLRVPPAWFQTTWFRALSALCVMLFLWCIHRLRLATLTARVRMQMTAQQIERERIARSMHDTLLQGFYALIMRLQTTVSRVAQETPPRAELELLLDEADAVLARSRDEMFNLRRPVGDFLDLHDALEQTMGSLQRDESARLSLLILGQPRELEIVAAREIHDIMAEGLANAVGHARAQQIDLHITYSWRTLELVLRDDGEGLPADFVISGKPGHGGIPGMRERAKLLGGRLEITADSGAGTTIRLIIPARRAYLLKRWRKGLFDASV